MKAPIYDIKGAVVKEIELKDSIFNVAVKDATLAQVLRVQIANRHQSSGHTLQRGEVRGGGKKPWRQKGTGRARAGSNRSPLWAGGGITFGPRKDRNPYLDIPAKMRQRATAAILTSRAKDKKIAILETTKDVVARKQFLSWCEKIKIEGMKILFVSDKQDEKLRQTVRNLPSVTTVGINSVNLIDTLNNDFVVATDSVVAFWGEQEKPTTPKPKKTTSQKTVS